MGFCVCSYQENMKMKSKTELVPHKDLNTKIITHDIFRSLWVSEIPGTSTNSQSYGADFTLTKTAAFNVFSTSFQIPRKNPRNARGNIILGRTFVGNKTLSASAKTQHSSRTISFLLTSITLAADFNKIVKIS